MKRRLLPLLLALFFILHACAASAEGITFMIEASITQTYMGASSTTEYFYDSVRLLENGIYEVQGGKIEDGVEKRVRWLYTESGVPIGTRSYDPGAGYTDSLNYFFYIDGTFDNYVSFLSGVDRIEDTTIYFADGAHETVYLTDGIISRTVRREANGAVSELILTPHGLLEEMFLYEPGESIFFLHVRTEYTELNVSDYLDR